MAPAWSTELYGTGGSIDALPDDVLFEILADCVVNPDIHPSERMLNWQCLVQVCERWQQLIYSSPKSLDLHFYCTNTNSFRKTLDLWPAFPLSVCGYTDSGQEDVIAALELRDRVRRIDLVIRSSDYDWVSSSMREQFPQLTNLDLEGNDAGDDDDHPRFDLDQFLGGSAPSLIHLCFKRLYFKGLPSLLLTAPNLVSLQLGEIRLSLISHVSPQTMIQVLAGLPKLKSLLIYFAIPRNGVHAFHEELEKHRRKASIRAVLPTLTEFYFRGISEYLEDLVAQIDAPQLDDLSIAYFSQEVQTRRLFEFINQTVNLKPAQFRRALLNASSVRTTVELYHPQDEDHVSSLTLTVWDFRSSPFPHMVNFLGQLVPTLSNVDHLVVTKDPDFVQRVDWLSLLQLFSAVRMLRVRGGLAGQVVSALEAIPEEMVPVWLPVLNLVWLYTEDNQDEDEPVGSSERFVSLRLLSGRPVVIANTHELAANVARQSEE